MGSLLSILQFIQIFEALLPVAKTCITAIESLIPDAAGSTKLAAVKVAVEGAFSQFNADLVKFEHVWATLVPVINAWVAVGRAEGVLSVKVAGNVAAIETKVNTVANVVEGLNHAITGTPAPAAVPAQ